MLINITIKKYSILFYTIISLAIFHLLLNVTVNYILPKSIIKNVSDLRLFSTVIFAFILDGIYAIIGVLLFCFVGRQNLKNFGFEFRKKEINVTLAGLAIMILMQILFIYLTSKLNLASWNFNYSKQIVPLYLLFAVLIQFLFVGIGEEFLYRGFLFKALEPYGRLVQYSANILIFVSVHFLSNEIYPMYFLELIVVTFLLCYIYEKTGSIWPGVILHGAVDLLNVLFTWNQKGVSVVLVWWKSDYSAGDAFELLSIISSILLIILVWFFYEQNHKKDITMRTITK